MFKIQIEMANTSHAREISQIVSTTFQGEQSKYTAIGQPGYSDYLIDLLEKGAAGPKFLVVGIVQDQVAAYADFILRPDEPNFLTRIAVKPAFQGRGIARALMKGIEASYTSTTVWELDVFDSNVGAIRMYKSLGFEIQSTSRWIGRSLPHIYLPATSRQDKATSDKDDSYRRYGFTNTNIDGHEISIAGSAVRCREQASFVDDQFLSKVQGAYPKTNRAFIVCSDNDHIKNRDFSTFEIDRSYRMLGNF